MIVKHKGRKARREAARQINELYGQYLRLMHSPDASDSDFVEILARLEAATGLDRRQIQLEAARLESSKFQAFLKARADERARQKPYYVVNAGHGRSTHIMQSKDASTPTGWSPGSVAAELMWFGGASPKFTLCGLTATRHVDVFTPAQASCRECRARWQRAVQEHPDHEHLPADLAGTVCTRCGRHIVYDETQGIYRAEE